MSPTNTFRLERAQFRARARASVLRLEVTSARLRLRFLERRREEFPMSRAERWKHDALEREAKQNIVVAETKLARHQRRLDTVVAMVTAGARLKIAAPHEEGSGT